MTRARDRLADPKAAALASLLCSAATRQAASPTARILSQRPPAFEDTGDGNPRVTLFAGSGSGRITAATFSAVTPAETPRQPV